MISRPVLRQHTPRYPSPLHSPFIYLSLCLLSLSLSLSSKLLCPLGPRRDLFLFYIPRRKSQGLELTMYVGDYARVNVTAMTKVSPRRCPPFESLSSSPLFFGVLRPPAFDVRETNVWQRAVFRPWTSGGRARRVSQELAGGGEGGYVSERLAELPPRCQQSFSVAHLPASIVGLAGYRGIVSCCSFANSNGCCRNFLLILTCCSQHAFSFLPALN